MQIIELFITDIILKANYSELRFDFVGDKTNLSYLLENSSDFDFIFYSTTDLKRFADLIIENMNQNKNIRLLSKRLSNNGEQWIFRFDKKVFMLDLMLEMRFHNFNLIDTRVYFELKDAGHDVVSIVKFIKSRTRFKEAWPKVPPEYYSFHVKQIRWVDRMVYLLHKVKVVAKSLHSAKSGVFVAVLGPDGSGKSTVIEKIAHSLCIDRAVIPVFCFHWRPRLLRSNTIPYVVIDPHANSPRGCIMSFIKLIYLLVVFNLGYWLKLRRLLHRDGIVIFDRYYHDMLVDARRYRLHSPSWLSRFVGCWIPSPDIWVLLDAPPDVLQARKQEVPFEETARQRDAYLQLICEFANGLVIDASRSAEVVAEDVTEKILDFLAVQNSH